MTEHEDDPPNTPPPVPSIALPSIPPPPPVPGDFGRNEGQQTEPSAGPRTLTDADLAAIAMAFEAVLDRRTQIHVDALNVARGELVAARADMQSTANRIIGESRDNLAQMANVFTEISLLKGMVDASLQQTSDLRQSFRPNARTGELSPSAAKALEELRATVDLDEDDFPHEEPPTKP